MYGAHVGYSGKSTDMMNKDPHKASCWKGRVLMEYWVELKFVWGKREFKSGKAK